MPAIKPLSFSKTKDLWRVHQFISLYRQEIIQDPEKLHENIKIIVVGISFF